MKSVTFAWLRSEDFVKSGLKENVVVVVVVVAFVAVFVFVVVVVAAAVVRVALHVVQEPV